MLKIRVIAKETTSLCKVLEIKDNFPFEVLGMEVSRIVDPYFRLRPDPSNPLLTARFEDCFAYSFSISTEDFEKVTNNNAPYFEIAGRQYCVAERYV